MEDKYNKYKQKNKSLCLFHHTEAKWHICVSKLGHHWCSKWLVTCLVPSHYLNQCCLFKSPQYTGGDFMFLYRFVRRRRPQILVHAITFEQLFGFLSFLAQLLALTCRLPDYIFVDFRRDLDLDFSRSNMEFAISQPKKVRLPQNEKQT